MTPDPTLRPATADDVEAVADLWHRGWHDGHAGHVPDGPHRRPHARGVRRAGPALVRRPPSPRWRGRRFGTRPRHPRRRLRFVTDRRAAEVAGFVVVIDDEVEQLFVAATHRGTGVAALLLDEGERQVAAQGYDEAWLAWWPATPGPAGSTNGGAGATAATCPTRWRRRDDVRLALPALPQAGPLTALAGPPRLRPARATPRPPRPGRSPPSTGTPLSWRPSR